MSDLWIVDADATRRRLLADLVAAGDDAVLGAPGDRALEAAPSPTVVLLGVGRDLGAELEFVHRLLPATSARSWLLFADPDLVAEARRLFDHPALDVVAWPPDPAALRARIDALARRSSEPSLGQRLARDACARRFAAFFCDLDLPELATALHPRRATVPLLVAGEPGTGRRLLARYRHEFGGLERGVFAEIACDALRDGDARALERALARALQGLEEADRPVTVFLHEVATLPLELQRAVTDWVELAPPTPLRAAKAVGWIASRRPEPPRGEPLDASLARAFSALEVSLPPLRERAQGIPALVEEFAHAHAHALGEPRRRFSDEALARLRAWPWPGNTRELEAVVRRTLLGDGRDPIPAEALRLRPGPARATTQPRSAPAAMERPALGALAEREPEPPGTSPLPDALRELVAALTAHLRGELAPLRELVTSLSEPAVAEERRRELRRDASGYLDQLGALVEHVESISQLPAPELVPIDLPALIDAALEPLGPEAEERKILLLKELDRARPVAYGDRRLLSTALCALARFALAELPERGDLFVSSRYVATGPDGRPTQRVLLRYRTKRSEGAGGDVALALVRWLVRPLEARFELDEREHGEVLAMLDLPAPEAT
jgi:two-component system response regulator PilR (NtrC family)